MAKDGGRPKKRIWFREWSGQVLCAVVHAQRDAAGDVAGVDHAMSAVHGNEADIANDTLHVVALASEAIDDTRWDLVREWDGPKRKMIEGTRFLLRKGLEHLDPGSLDRRM